MSTEQRRRRRLGPDADEKARTEWEPWCRALSPRSEYAQAALDAAVDYLDAGFRADVVAAILELRAGAPRNYDRNRATVNLERSHCERVRLDLPGLRDAGVITAMAYDALDREYEGRLTSLSTWADPIVPARTTRAIPPAATTEAIQLEAPLAPPTPPAPPAPVGPPFSLRDVFAEHSVLILGSFGAFLLVVATVLFELYGTVGLGGTGRFAAVAVLDALFAAAGYLALRQPNLRSVGQIYTALAAVLLPLVGLAAWTFLELDRHGITVDQAVAAVGLACALTYGVLAMRLDLLAYGEMSGLAILVASWGASGAISGSHWRAVGLAVTPLVYAVWNRYLRSSVFKHFQWFAHASAGIALIDAGRTFDAGDWLWTSTLATLGIAYLAWQAISAQPYRAWIGEAALVLAAAAASGPLGIGQYHFLLPMALGVPLLVLARAPEDLGVAGRLYRAHPALLHLAMGAGLFLAAWQNVLGETWPLAGALWVAFALYLADLWAGDDRAGSYATRAILPLALAATGQALQLDTWTAALVSLALFAYLVPWARPWFEVLRQRSSYFFYGTLALCLLCLDPVEVAAGRWQIPATLLAASIAFAAAGELGAVRLGGWAARGLFSLGWFATVDALNAQGWRGPFDAVLPLFYTALAQVRALRSHVVAMTGRRWFVHATAAAAVALCLTGPEDQQWWRLTAAFALLAVAYWWQELRLTQVETPWLAWSSTALAAFAVTVATVHWPWKGAVMIAAAVALTAAWAGARRVHRGAALEESAFTVLSTLALIGAIVALRDAVPHWHQAIGAVVIGVFALAWSVLATTTRLRPFLPTLRAAAAAFASTGVLLGAAVLHLDAAYSGLIAIAIAAAHGVWSVRTKQAVEHWYSIAAVIALAIAIYYWPYSHSLPLALAIEFVALAVVLLAAGMRGRKWYLAYPAALLLVPALDQSLTAFGFAGDREVEESCIAGLAWAIGFVGLAARPFAGRMWALSTQAAAATVAVSVVLAMAVGNFADPAGVALLAFAPEVYVGAMQERQRWGLPAAPATALIGAIVLLAAHQADTIYYAAALGLVGLVMWVAGRVALGRIGRGALIDMHRYLGLGLLAASGLAGFFFPDRTGAASIGAVLAALALLVTGGVMWLDSQTFLWRPNFYIAIFVASCAGYFVARYVSLTSWELVAPGVGAIACGILLRHDRKLPLDRRIRQLTVAFGLGLAMGWAATFTVSGDLYWLVVLLIEGTVTIAAGIVLRSRVLVAGGGAAVAVVSLRALLSVAQAGYLFAAFAAVAVVLLIVATALAVGRERFVGGSRGMREQLATWD